MGDQGVFLDEPVSARIGVAEEHPERATGARVGGDPASPFFLVIQDSLVEERPAEAEIDVPTPSLRCFDNAKQPGRGQAALANQGKIGVAHAEKPNEPGVSPGLDERADHGAAVSIQNGQQFTFLE